jgi:glycosyltransferase involved in cell wall biosynthesis
MRLTLVHQFYPPDSSPVSQLLSSLAHHRAAQGDEVTVLTAKGSHVGELDAPPTPAPNLRVVRFWTPNLGKSRTWRRFLDYSAFYLRATWKAVWMPRQDVFIGLTLPPLIACVGAVHKALHPRAKLVLWNMDCYPDVAERTGVLRPGGLVSRLARRLNRALYRRLDRVVCLDGAMCDFVRTHYLPRNGTLGLTAIPNWEPLAFYRCGVKPPPWAPLSRLGLEGQFVVLYSGNAGYGHEFETALAAAEMLKDEKVRFLFVGGGARWNWIRQAVAARGLPNVVMQNYVPKKDLPSVLASGHCALVTLREDMLGVMSPSKVHACLAMGLPILYVGPPGSNVDEAVRSFGCGISLRNGDAAGLAAGVRRLRDSPPARAELARSARQAFDQAFSDQQVLPRFDALLKELLAGGS